VAHYDNTRKAWRIAADATRPGEKRRRVVRLVKAPNNAAGEREAIAAEVRLRDQVAEDLTGPEAGTFAAAARAWQLRARSRRGPWTPSTRRTVADALNTHILPALGDRKLDEITAADIEALYTRWSATLAPSNIRRKHGMIRKIYADAVRLGELRPDRNPMSRVEPGGAPAPERMNMPTGEHVRALADKAGEHSPAATLFIYLAAVTGARRGSVLALRWRNVDLEAGIIHVDRALSLGVDGKAHEGANKGKKPYAVHIAGRVVDLLAEARRRATETALALGERARFDDLYLFSSDGGLTPWSVSHPSKVFRLAARDLGLSWPAGDDGDGGMTLHDLRHFAASNMLARRVPARYVAERLGCTEANVLRTYSHYIPSLEAVRAADVMAEALG
jgi:integrase